VQDNSAVFSQNPRAVIEALCAVLVDRGELAASLAGEIGGNAAAAFESSGAAEISSESVQLARDRLVALVREDARHYVRDRGGRYVVNVAIEAVDGGTRVTVTPTFIAYVPGMETPLGGRPLPSNGMLERTILDALGARLQGGP
jgi:hypothetical protein